MKRTRLPLAASLVLIFLWGLFPPFTNAQNAPFPRQPSKDALKWADQQLKKMTLDEKIGQLISIGHNARFVNQDSAEFRELRRHITENHVGGVILFQSPVYESAVLLNRLQQLAKYPLLVSADLESGTGMRFDDTVRIPWNMAVAATGNPEFARQQGALTAREARALGVQHIYAPVVDVNNNADNPVINVRSYGEDPADVGRFAAAFIAGAQQNGTLATAKHFPGHGDTATDSHRGLPIINVDRKRLDSIEFAPFQASINAGVASVMVGHIGLPQIDPTEIKPLKDAIGPTDTESEVKAEKATLPATLSPVVNTQILRGDMKFDGLIVTDAMSMSGLTIYFHQDEAAVRAVLAGADMLLKPADVDAATRGLREAVKSGRLTEPRIEASARRILAAKYDLGLVRQRLVDINAIDRIVNSPDAGKLADDIAARAVTLVRDDKKILPLAKDKSIFVLGITNGDDRNFIARPFASALARAGRRFDMVVLDERATQEERGKAMAGMGADIIVVAMYGRTRSGAANSGTLPESGAWFLRNLPRSKRYVVGVSFGNPYLLKEFPDLPAYVVAYGDMNSLQAAAANALAGQADFTGRLPITLPGLYQRGTGIQLKAVASAQQTR